MTENPLHLCQKENDANQYMVARIELYAPTIARVMLKEKKRVSLLMAQLDSEKIRKKEGRHCDI
jgi:hypothetical protein